MLDQADGVFEDKGGPTQLGGPTIINAGFPARDSCITERTQFADASILCNVDSLTLSKEMSIRSIKPKQSRDKER